MPTRIDEADCTPEAILKSFMNLDLPDATEFKLTTRDGRQLYLDAWHDFKRESTTLEHKLAVNSALGTRDPLSQTVRKVSKFVKQSRELASRAIEVYKMFGDVAQARDDDPLQFLWLFGKPKDVKRQETAVNRRMTAEGDRIIKQYDRLWHERELLLTQIQVVAPQIFRSAQ
jgi:hypothetical protein